MVGRFAQVKFRPVWVSFRFVWAKGWGRFWGSPGFIWGWANDNFRVISG